MSEKKIKLSRLLEIMDESYHGDKALQAIHGDANYDPGDGLIQFIYYETIDILGPHVSNDRELSLEDLRTLFKALNTSQKELLGVAASIVEKAMAETSE